MLGHPAGLCRGGNPGAGKRLPISAARGGNGFWGLPGAAGTQLQARYVQFASPSPSVGSWDGRQNTFVKRFQIQRFEDLEK